MKSRRSFLQGVAALAATLVTPLGALAVSEAKPKMFFDPTKTPAEMDERMQLLMQLYQQGKVSRTLLLENVGINYDQEVERLRQEQAAYHALA